MSFTLFSLLHLLCHCYAFTSFLSWNIFYVVFVLLRLLHHFHLVTSSPYVFDIVFFVTSCTSFSSSYLSHKCCLLKSFTWFLSCYVFYVSFILLHLFLSLWSCCVFYILSVTFCFVTSCMSFASCYIFYVALYCYIMFMLLGVLRHFPLVMSFISLPCHDLLHILHQVHHCALCLLHLWFLSCCIFVIFILCLLRHFHCYIFCIMSCFVMSFTRFSSLYLSHGLWIIFSLC